MQRLDAPAIVVRRGVVAAANARALQLLDTPPGELVGRPLRTVLRLHAHRPDAHAVRHDGRSGSLRQDADACTSGGRRMPVELHRLAHRRDETLWLLAGRGELHRRHADLLGRHARLQSRAAAEAADHERQRRHTARVVHDHVQQNLAAVQLELQAVRAAVAGLPVELGAGVARAVDGLTRAMQAARDLVGELGPALLDELGLVPALADLAARVEGETGWRIRCDCGAGEPMAERSGRARALVLFRSAEAGLRSLARQAPRGAAHLTLRGFGDTGLVLAIESDTGTIDPTTPPFAALRDWARELHGDLVVDVPGDGTSRLAVHLDLAPEPPAGPGPAPRSDDDTLLRLFYRLPVGVMLADRDGRVEQMNPMAARLMLPILHPHAFDNLFDALPGLRDQVDAGPAVARVELPRKGSVAVRFDVHRQDAHWLVIVTEAD